MQTALVTHNHVSPRRWGEQHRTGHRVPGAASRALWSPGIAPSRPDLLET